MFAFVFEYAVETYDPNVHVSCVPSMSLHRAILLDQRLRLTHVSYGHFSGASSGQRSKRLFLRRLSTATIYAFEQVSNVANWYLAYYMCSLCSYAALEYFLYAPVVRQP
jgi:hypothetical protein